MKGIIINPHELKSVIICKDNLKEECFKKFAIIKGQEKIFSLDEIDSYYSLQSLKGNGETRDFKIRIEPKKTFYRQYFPIYKNKENVHYDIKMDLKQ